MRTKHILDAAARLSLATGAVVPTIAASAQNARNAQHEGERPNVIFILTDDQRWDAAGYAGNAMIRTPEIDRLAGEGVVFRNAFVTTPISAASRASLLTGMYERTHGYTFGTGNLKPAYAERSYPAVMRENGYTTALYGKLGVDINGPGRIFEIFDAYDRSDYPDRRGYFYKTIKCDTVHLTRYTGHQARQFIRNVGADEPFCLWLGFSAPHAQDNAPEQYFWDPGSDGMYDGITVPPPPLGEDRYFEALPEPVREGYNRLRWTWRFDTPEKYQRSVKGYYRMISDVDREIGRIRETLRERGMDRNTVIIFMGDNGYFLGERQLAGKWLMYDNSLRVPLIVYDPRGESREVTDMALNIDVASTILDAAGIAAPESWQGISLLPYARGERPAGARDSFVCEHLWEIRNIPSSEGIRTDGWKYFRYRFIEDSEELYDLTADPLEKSDLAKDPRYAARLAELRAECDSMIGKLVRQRQN